MSEWQPIETAPKDGTYVLLYEKSSSPSCEVGFFDNVEAAGSLNRDGSVYEGCWFHDLNAEPTHWQPLPDPPSAA